MKRFAEDVDLNKRGIVRLDETGAYAVIANRTLHGMGAAGKFSVANTQELWVASVHEDQAEAVAESQQLSSM